MTKPTVTIRGGFFGNGATFYVLGPRLDSPGWTRLRAVSYGPDDDGKHGICLLDAVVASGIQSPIKES